MHGDWRLSRRRGSVLEGQLSLGAAFAAGRYVGQVQARFHVRRESQGNPKEPRCESARSPERLRYKQGRWPAPRPVIGRGCGWPLAAVARIETGVSQGARHGKDPEKYKPSEAWDLAAAPLAKPGTSKHGTGYAFDIHGDNVLIKSICSGLGATLVFDEKSHVHVEFKQGILVGRAHTADDWHDGRWSGWMHGQQVA